MRSIRRPFFGVLLALVAFATLAGPAAAHTGFESSDPSDGAILDVPVETITLVFSGEAEPTGDGFEVLDPTGQIRTPTEATTADGLTWTLRFDPAIAAGEIGLRWSVKAPDAHPISGGFRFTVLDPIVEPVDEVAGPVEVVAEPVDEAAIQQTSNSETPLTATVNLETFLDEADAPPSSAENAGAAGRMITLAGTLVGVGALVFAATVLRGAPRDVFEVLFAVRGAGLLVAIGAVVELVAQLAQDGGAWTAIWSLSTIDAVLFSSFGIAVALRIGGGLALASGARVDVALAEDTRDPVVAIRELVGAGVATSSPVANVGDRLDQPPTSRTGREPFVHYGDHAWRPTLDSGAAFFGAIALVAAHLFDGHTLTKGSRLLTGLLDMIHVVGAAVWVGGVVALVSVMWKRHQQQREVRALQLGVRFSVIATIAIVAVGAAGIALAVVILDSPSELWTTDWGKVLIVKTALVAVVAAAGGYNHRVLLPAMSESPTDQVLISRFRAIASFEAVVLLLVLVVTAILMGAAS